LNGQSRLSGAYLSFFCGNGKTWSLSEIGGGDDRMTIPGDTKITLMRGLIIEVTGTRNRPHEVVLESI